MAWILTLPMLVAQAASDPTVIDAVTQPATVPTADGLSGIWKLLIAIAVIVGSFALGKLLSDAIRLPEFGFKLGLISLAIIGSSAICYFGWPPKLGIDLSGGVVLVYEVEGSAAQSGKLQDLADLVAARVNDGRKEKVTARVEKGAIELVLPADADVATVESKVAALRGEGAILNKSGQREDEGATILVYEPDSSVPKVDMDKLVAAVNLRVNPSGVKEVTVRQYGAEAIEIIIPEVEQSEVDTIKNIISTSGALEFRILANPKKTEHKRIIEQAEASPAAELVETGPEGRRVVAKWVNVTRDIGGENAVIREKRGGKGAECLVVMDPFNVTGQYLRRAAPDIDQTGRDCITFSFKSDGAQLFGALTGANVPDAATGIAQRLGIVLDNELISAPTLQSQIRDQGQITGAFDKKYVETIVSVLNAGSLPTALQKTPIQDQRISAQLGADTIRQGSMAMGIASLGVVLFMLFYYRFAGAVADGAVILNMLMAIALMILIKAAFTLPGLAGLVLTVGMAVDANVLIYERMREELGRGASLRMAIRNGYARAMSTIIDSNVTTIATGVVLFAIGSDQIKGFAVTLILGLLVSLFTAVFVSRVVFDIFEKKRWLKQLNMLQWFKKTDFDFIGMMRPAAVLSVLVIGAGLFGVLARGKDLLDIDFTGGSSVQVQFRKDAPQDIADVRKAVAELPDVAVSSIGTQNLEFKVDTSERDVNVVRDVLKDAFGKSLNTYSMTYDDVKPFQPTTEPAPAATGTDKAALPAEKEPAKESDSEAKPADKDAAPTEKEAEPTAETPSVKPVEEPVKEPASETAEPAKEEAPKTDSPAAEPAKPADEKKPTAQLNGSGRPQEFALITAALAQPAADEKPADEKPADEKPVEETAPAESDKAADKTESPEKAEATDSAESKDEAPAPEEKKSEDESTAPAETPESKPEVPAAQVGTSVTMHFSAPINHATLRERVNGELKAAGLEGTYFELSNPEFTPGSSLRYNDWTLSILLPEAEAKSMLEKMQDKLANEPVFPSANEIGGKVAGKTQSAAIYAILASLVMIVMYVWIRFQNVLFGFAAVLALIHDVLVALGFLALSYWIAKLPGAEFLLVDQFKISLAVVAALLTIVGFSINDTIVIFDRIREIRGKSPELTGKMINQAVNETLSRTFITSGTVLIATLILYVVGGAGIHPFAFAMLIGVISGTYSTVFIAAPVLLWMKAPGSSSGGKRVESSVPATSAR